MCPCVCLLNCSRYIEATSKVVAEQHAALMASTAKAKAKGKAKAKAGPAAPVDIVAPIADDDGDEPAGPTEPPAKKHKADHASTVDTTPHLTYREKFVQISKPCEQLI